MASCPACKAERIAGEEENCPICGSPIPSTGGWMRVGTVPDQITADFAVETLKSVEIPAVQSSGSGYFGSIGLPLVPFYSGSEPQFLISVPAAYRDEAAELLSATLGDKFHEMDVS